jgi:hypothetical protein
MVQYVQGIYLKETQFSIKFTGDVDKLIEELQKHKKANGKFRFEIKKRKEVDKNGNTHYIVVDEWEPQAKNNSEYPGEVPF